MKKNVIQTMVTSLVFASSISHAQSSTIETMIVTANRFEQSIESTTLPIEIITKEEIDTIQAKSVTEILRRLPSVQVSSHGGYGQIQSIHVRGSESDHILFLINGVRMANATSGTAAISAIPTVAIEKIEFLRGSRGAVYGSDAIGGVINIITQHNRTESIVTAGVGSDNFSQGQISISNQVREDTHISVAANRFSTDGYSALNGIGNEDDDGYDSQDVITTFAHAITDKVSIDIQALYHEGEVEYDPADAYNNEKLYNIAGSLNYEGQVLTSAIQLGVNQDYSKDHVYGSIYQTDRHSLVISNQYRVSDSFILGVGGDWYKDNVSKSTDAYDEASRSNTAFYVSSMYEHASFQLDAAVRTDDNERYGQNTTWQLGTGWRLSPNNRLMANVGTGFKAPSFNELYSPYGGNSNVRPEKSKSYEIALESHRNLVNWRMAGYVNYTKELIVWQPTGPFTSSPKNIGEVEVKGGEISASFKVGNFYHDVSIDLMDPLDKEHNRQLARRAKQSAKWNVTYFADNWQADMSYLYQGKRYDYLYGGRVAELDPYSLVDLAISYFVSDFLVVRGRVANLFDTNYILSEGSYGPYNTQDRSYFADLEYRF